MSDTTLKYLDNIGQELVDAGLISSDQLAVVKETQKNMGGDLGHILIRKGFVTTDQILEFLSKRLNIPFLSLKDYTIDPEVLKLVPISLSKKYHFMPLFKIEDNITVAMADPLDVFAVDEIRAALKYKVTPVLGDAEEIESLITANYRMIEDDTPTSDEIEVVQYGTDVSGGDDVSDKLKEMASGSRVIKEVNRILKGAIAERASDVHIEPLSSSVKIRNRIDGVLEERLILEKNMHLPIVTRIKIMSSMDIAERRVPQDGRVRIKLHGRVIDMRVSTYPTMNGEKVVIRLLARDDVIGVESLGFKKEEKDIFERIITNPHGIFLVSGPTGSGKTTTLYAALQRLNSQDRNIVSIEDPIENEIGGVSQAQVNTKAGMTFASAMRSILRQDPDIIMLGEIRDQETAEIAVRAAITGHLVFSTIHTNTAVGSVTRLVDLDVEPFLVASAMAGVMSQRLVRKICTHCKYEVESDPVQLEALGLAVDTKIFKGKGCKHCRMSGYSGRLGLFELVEVNHDLKVLIAQGENEDVLLNYVRSKGVKDLRWQGAKLVSDGITTVDEVLRVTEANR